MSKRYYAGAHVLSRDFVYGDGWTVWVFDNKKDRDNFVDKINEKCYMRGVSPTSEAITRKIAQKIVGNWVEEIPMNDNDDGYYLEHYSGYYNPYYWGNG